MALISTFNTGFLDRYRLCRCGNTTLRIHLKTQDLAIFSMEVKHSITHIFLCANLLHDHTLMSKLLLLFSTLRKVIFATVNSKLMTQCVLDVRGTHMRHPKWSLAAGTV